MVSQNSEMIAVVETALKCVSQVGDRSDSVENGAPV